MVNTGDLKSPDASLISSTLIRGTILICHNISRVYVKILFTYFGVIMSNEKLAKLLNEANVLLDAIELTIENMFSAARDVHRSNDSL